MRKRVLLPSLIAVALIGGLIVTQVNAIKQDKPLANPVTIDKSIDTTKLPVTGTSKEPLVKPPVEKTGEKAIEPTAKSVLSSQLALNLPSKTIRDNNEGLAVITNTTSTFVLVNKQRNLPSTYVPTDLVVPKVAFSFSGDSPKKKLRKEAAEALELLFEAAKKDDITLYAVSGYRSYETQKAIFASNAKREGEKVANLTSARPGQSEHQTGLAMDISSASVKYALKESFGETKEGKWLSENAAEHGFIIRYLKGKEHITGYTYEPWHVRYVGKEVAKDIYTQQVTLEQYFDAVAVSLQQ